MFFEKANGRDEPMTAFNVKCKEAIKAETLAEYNNDGGVEISGKQLKVSYADGTKLALMQLAPLKFHIRECSPAGP